MGEEIEKDEESFEVVRELLRALKKVGLKRVTKTLTELSRGNTSNNEDLLLDFILQKVCDFYSVAKNDLKSKYALETVQECRSVAIVLIKKHLNFTHIAIAKVFGKDNHSIVSEALGKFKDKSEKIKKEAIYLRCFNDVDESVKNYKNLILANGK